MPVSEIADWWDLQKADSEKILTEWVQENPQWWAIGIATATQTSMELGGSMVDVLRLGEGAAEGGIGGYGKDALRLLVLAGPAGKALGIGQRVAQVSRLSVATQVAGVDGPCTFQAVTNAVKIATNKNMFVTVQEMAAALKIPMRTIPRNKDGIRELSAWIDELVP